MMLRKKYVKLIPRHKWHVTAQEDDNFLKLLKMMIPFQISHAQQTDGGLELREAWLPTYDLSTNEKLALW